MDEQEDFINKWRVKIGCKHWNANICWCEICTALETLWDDIPEIRENNSEEDIRKEVWRYIPEKQWYIYLIGEGDSVSFSAQERGKLSGYFFPGRSEDEESREYHEKYGAMTFEIGLFHTDNHKNKIFLIVKNPEVELS